MFFVVEQVEVEKKKNRKRKYKVFWHQPEEKLGGLPSPKKVEKFENRRIVTGKRRIKTESPGKSKKMPSDSPKENGRKKKVSKKEIKKKEDISASQNIRKWI